MAVTLAATINVVYGIWDALNDPLFGYLSDNTRTRWGRRRPWLLVGLIGAALAGLGLGGIKICREMIVANLVDQNLARTGHRREGAYYSLLRVFGKLSKVLEAGALALLGVLFGYVSGEDPGPAPGNAFRFLIGALPFVLLTLALLVSHWLPFGSPQAESET